MSLEIYTAWDKVPSDFKTKTQLAKMGLRPVKGQKPVAIFDSIYYKKEYSLYSSEQAVAKRKPSPKQLAVLEQNRIKARTCQLCGQVFERPLKICWRCEHHLEHQVPVIQWARKMLENQETVVLDTETTGLEGDDEIVEIAITDIQGHVLLDTLIKPTQPILVEAQSIHGIKDNMVANAPSFRQICREVCLLLTNKPVIIYNADFDMRLLKQSARKHGLWLFHEPFQACEVHCAMLKFAEYYGDWNKYYEDFRWQKLGVAISFFGIQLPQDHQFHRALGDTQACQLLVKALAQQNIRRK